MDLLLAFQRWINTAITADLSAFAATRSWTALAAVLPLGIVFGAAHALTPGHGKTVLATYLAGSRLAVVRGIAVAGRERRPGLVLEKCSRMRDTSGQI